MTESHEVVVPDIKIISSYREKYGNRFVPEIDITDEMYLDYFKVPNINPILAYYECGESILDLLERILFDDHRTLHDLHSLMDFASGYGRFTRFIACRMDPNLITASDIDHRAVDFCTNMYGVNGIYSVRDPEKWHIPQHFDVIIVISLFSHLSFELWVKWMNTLYDSLEENGLLIFTTHGEELLEKLNIQGHQKIEDGFFFLNRSETNRLSKEDYGTTFISENFVRKIIKEQNIGELIHYYPLGLQKFQDVYVIKRIRKPKFSLFHKLLFR